MKLIIEIDNEAYKGLVTEGHIFVKHIFDAVKNGTSIPDNATVCDIEQIRAEIEETIESYVCDTEENTMKAQGMLNAMQMTFEILDKYRKSEE